MGRSAILSIKILADARQAIAELDKTEQKVTKSQYGLEKAKVPAAIAIAAVGAFAVASGKAASDVQQSMGAVDSVFGKSADQIKAWSDTSAEAVGLSKNQYGEMAAVIGAQLRNMGVPVDELAGKTNDLVTMGADLAATFGGTTAESVEALSSLLRGETDPIEKYGISIKAADVAARMAADGTDKLKGEAGKAAKTQALLALATEQSGGAMGQFSRETDSAAGAQQIATAKWEDAKAVLGEALLPAMGILADVLGTVADAAAAHPALFYGIVGAVVALSAAILVLNAVTAIQTSLTTAFGAAAVAAWWAALWPILLVIAAIALVVGAIVLLWKKNETFRNAVLAVWAAIKAGISAVVTWLKAAWSAIWPVLKAAMRPFLTAVSLGFRLIAAVARVVGAVIKEIWRVVWWAIRVGALGLKIALTTAFNAVKGPIKSVADFVKRVWDSVFGALKRAASSLGDALSGPFDVVRRAVQSVIDAVESLISWLGRIKVPRISLPKIPGVNANAAPSVAAPGVAATANRLGASRATTPGSTAGLTIVIQGAIDPESTARQIRRILTAHDRRLGIGGPGLRAGTV